MTNIAKLLKILKYVIPTIYSHINPVVPKANAIIRMEMKVKKNDFKCITSQNITKVTETNK